MYIAYSVNKIPIRLPLERWFHIIENHNDLAGSFDEILDTIESPDFILQGYRDALIAVKKIRGNKYLAVVYKEVSNRDGFVITAYQTTKVKKEAKIWHKQQ